MHITVTDQLVLAETGSLERLERYIDARPALGDEIVAGQIIRRGLVRPASNKETDVAAATAEALALVRARRRVQVEETASVTTWIPSPWTELEEEVDVSQHVRVRVWRRF